MTKQVTEDPRRIRLYRSEAEFLLWVLENFRVTVKELLKLEETMWSEWTSANFLFAQTHSERHLKKKNRFWRLYSELDVWELRSQLGAASLMSERLRGWLAGGKPRGRPILGPLWLFEK